MNLRAELLKEHSLVQATKICAWATRDQKHLQELMNIFFSAEPLYAQRAAWAASKVFEAKPEWFSPYIPKLISLLSRDTHDGVRRNALRILQFVEIPEASSGEAVDAAFRLLSSPQEAIAVKVFAMTVIHNQIRRYPELKQELRILLEDQLPYSGPGFRSRAAKILKDL